MDASYDLLLDEKNETYLRTGTASALQGLRLSGRVWVDF